MSIIDEREGGAKGTEVSDEYKTMVFLHMPALGRLLDLLDAGTTPTFLDTMAAISEMVAFYTEDDSLESEESLRFFNMSGKICRFCY